MLNIVMGILDNDFIIVIGMLKIVLGLLNIVLYMLNIILGILSIVLKAEESSWRD